MVRYIVGSRGEYIPVDEQGKQIKGLPVYERYYGLDRPNYGHFIGPGTAAEFDKLVLSLLNTGKPLSKTALDPKKGDKAYAELMSDLDKFIKSNKLENYQNEFAQRQKQYGLGTDPEPQEEFNPFADITDFDDPTSTGSKVAQTIYDQLKLQHQMGMQESQFQERDMNRMIGMERQNLIDQIREDRRRQLKSGLSQSAIANREIQGLLQGQAMASSIGEEFLAERRQLGMMGSEEALRAQSRMGTLDMFGQGLGNVYGATKAASAADMGDWFKRYQQYSEEQKLLYKAATKNQ